MEINEEPTRQKKTEERKQYILFGDKTIVRDLTQFVEKSMLSIMKRIEKRKFAI